MSLIDHWKDHPFNIYPPERLQELADSIEKNGLHSPIIVRRSGQRYQIIAGHNRYEAHKLLNRSEIMARVVKNLDDTTAAIMVTESNLLQREQILPSEKARAYRMLIDALNARGEDTHGVDADENETGGSDTMPYGTMDRVASITSDNRRQIYRYLRLLKLNDALLVRVDSEQIPFRAAVALSYLREASLIELELLLSQSQDIRVTVIAADRLKELCRDGKLELSREAIAAVLRDSVAEGASISQPPEPTEPLDQVTRAARLKKSGLLHNGVLNHAALLRRMKKDRAISLSQRRLLEGTVAEAIEKAKQDTIRDFMRTHKPGFDLDTYISSLSAEEVIEE
ncbi:MAG: ParB/RepB/Spo0J family partition protein [Symbiobacteriaceae bacterium]|nr:ParB/RepB/Spo0J family partition protein [Symbiobacteriaceae bacterium]